MREHRNNRIQLGTQNPSLSNVCIWVSILANLIFKISDSRLNRPLRITGKWPNMGHFGCNMSEQVNALSDEVDVVGMTLII
jgi:hypothetical protein